MFISVLDLNIEETDDSTYFSVTSMDAMENPEERLRFDHNSNYEYGKWIQVRAAKPGDTIPEKFWFCSSNEDISKICDFRIFNIKSKCIL